jgi:MFS family permease
MLFPSLGVNKIVRVLIYSDFLLISAFGFLSPIFAIFLTDQLVGGSIQVAGFATTAYWLVKSIVQIPAARYIDARRGERDDFWLLVVGSTLMSVIPFLYLLARVPWHIYVLQALLGIGAAIAFPGWFAIFTRHMDKFKEGFEWSLHSVAIGLGISGTAALGGVLADLFGFATVFVLVGAASALGTIVLFLIRDEILHSDRTSTMWQEWDKLNGKKKLMDKPGPAAPPAL